MSLQYRYNIRKSTGRGACQDDSILAYLFILTLEILFFLIRESPHIKRLNIFDHCYLYSAYADDTTFLINMLIP